MSLLDRMKRLLTPPESSGPGLSASLPLGAPALPPPPLLSAGRDLAGAGSMNGKPAAAAETPGASQTISSSRNRRMRIHQAFDASMPVEDRHGLAGRNEELESLLESVLEQQKHGIIFGARGSGKTSLARVFGDLADEARCTVIYNSASGDIGFSELCRTYLHELSAFMGEVSRNGQFQSLLCDPFDARQLAGFLTEHVRRPTVFILDEFDRIQSRATKDELASLMKLLSDMRSRVRLVVVGIAANLEDLLEGHPSLRRHMVSMPISAIPSPALASLLDLCCAKAEIDITPDAATMIVKAAMGSPYHLRLFGLHAALEAERATLDGGAPRIDDAVVQRGLANALREWSSTSPELSSRFRQFLAKRPAFANGVVTASVLAAYKARFSVRSVRLAMVEMGIADDMAAAVIARDAIAYLEPILRASATDDDYMFADSLLPQFFMLMHKGVGEEGEASGAADAGNRPGDMAPHILRNEIRSIFEEVEPRA